MLIKGTPLEYAASQHKFWSDRLATAQRMGTTKRAGEFASKATREREIAACRGAIQALDDILLATYIDKE